MLKHTSLILIFISSSLFSLGFCDEVKEIPDIFHIEYNSDIYLGEYLTQGDFTVSVDRLKNSPIEKVLLGNVSAKPAYTAFQIENSLSSFFLNAGFVVGMIGPATLLQPALSGDDISKRQIMMSASYVGIGVTGILCSVLFHSRAIISLNKSIVSINGK